MSSNYTGEIVAGAVTAFLGLMGWLGARFTGRSARRASREEDGLRWERKYRSGAEAHIRWDTLMVAEFRRMQYRVQDLEKAQGLDPSPVIELPDPPPLFPDGEEEKQDGKN